jgi:hypothetical protein
VGTRFKWAAAAKLSEWKLSSPLQSDQVHPASGLLDVVNTSQ